MEFCGIALSPAETVAIAGIATTLLSEAIAASPLRENSIVQIGLSLFKGYSKRIGAHAPVISGRKADPLPKTDPPSRTASPAPRRRGRPPGSGKSSQSGSKKA